MTAGIGRRTHHDHKPAGLFLHRHFHVAKRFLLGSLFLLLLLYNSSTVFYLHLPFNPPPAAPANFSSSSSDEPKPGRHLDEKPDLQESVVAVNESFPGPAGLITRRKPGRKGRSAKWHIAKEIRTFQPKHVTGPKFTARIREFFRSSDCNPRFFMTLISPGAEGARLGPREFFAVESLFRSNPNACLIIVSNTMDTEPGRILLKPFTDRNLQIAAVKPDFGAAFKNTPAETWFRGLKSGRIRPGLVSLAQNLSNLLRLALLYKFGGVYLDTDVVVLRSFAGLRNCIGAQTVDVATGKWSRLNNAVMVFDRSHPLVYKFMEEFAATFDGSKWGHNGPYLVSRVVEREEEEGRGGLESELTVLPPAAFYPVDWSRISGLFEGPRDGDHLRWVERKLEQIKRESFAVHLWNRWSRDVEVEDGSVMKRIMMEYCSLCNSSSWSSFSSSSSSS